MNEFMISNGVLLRYNGKGGEVSVPSGVTKISSGCFRGNNDITGITVPEGVTAIGANAFYKCASLTYAILPESLSVISASSFSDCNSLVSVTVRGSVEYCGEYAFYGTDDDFELHLRTPSLTAFGVREKLAVVRGFLSDYYSGEHISDDTERQLDRYIRSSRKRLSDMLGGSYLFFKYLCEKEYVAYDDIELYLGKASTPEAKTELLSYRDKLFTPELQMKLAKREERKLNRLLSDAPLTVSELKRIWQVSMVNGCYCLKAYHGYATEIVIPQHIGKYPITSISEYAFSPDADGITAEERNIRRCVTSVTVPDGIRSIDYKAFAGCGALERIDIPDTLEVICDNVFEACRSLTSIKLPDNLRAFGYDVFIGCASLNDIYIPDTVKILDVESFNGTKLLADYNGEDMLFIGNHLLKAGRITDSIVRLRDGVKTIAHGAFQDCGALECLELPEGLVSIGNEAFLGCNELKVINFPSSLEYVGQDAFKGCHSLSAVYITDIKAWFNIRFASEKANPLSCNAALALNGETVTEIDIPVGVGRVRAYALACYGAITSVRIPSSVKVIEPSAFAGCRKLSKVELSEGLEIIARCAFTKTPSLKEIELPRGLISVREYAFKRSGIKSVTLHRALKAVYDEAFAESRAETVEISANPDYLDRRVFMGCSSLRRVVIHSGVKNIKLSMFRNCVALESVEIPPSVEHIDEGVFYGCHRLVVTLTQSSYAESYCKENRISYVYKKG